MALNLFLAQNWQYIITQLSGIIIILYIHAQTPIGKNPFDYKDFLYFNYLSIAIIFLIGVSLVSVLSKVYILSDFFFDYSKGLFFLLSGLFFLLATLKLIGGKQ